MLRKSYEMILSKIYKDNTVHADEVFNAIERIHNDHRDFYPPVALINSGYIGYTGAVPPSDLPFSDTMLVHAFQALTQGEGVQTYKTAHIVVRSGEPNYFFIAGKGVDYFSSRKAENKKILISSFLSFFAAVSVAVISVYLKYLTGP